jgi:hypothetical protein
MAQKGTHTAFFYGTLTSPPILYRVLYLTSQPSPSLTGHLTITPAILHGYCRHRVQDADYPGVIEEEGKCVRGTYVTGLTSHNIRNLDVFEGDEYERRKVSARILRPQTSAGVNGKGEGNGAVVEPHKEAGEDELEEAEEVTTETYVFLYPNRLERREWDFEEFVREKAHRWVMSDEEYAGRSDGLRHLYYHVMVMSSGKRRLADVFGWAEVDQAANGHDPTGGRAARGQMDRRLTPVGYEEDREEGKEERLDEEEVLKSAV